jgi:origin recognition complex subunit 1
VILELSDLHNRGELFNFEYIEINGMKLPQPHHAYSVLWKQLTGKQCSPAKAALELEKRFSTQNSRRPIW